jgi:hypothetical protein
MSLTQILGVTSLIENHWTKLIKAALGLEVTFDTTSTDALFSPELSNVQQRTMINRGGLKYSEHWGLENVNFRRHNIRGFFTHDASSLYQLECNMTTKLELSQTIASIAVYCKYGFHSSSHKSLNAVQDEQFMVCQASPWLFLHAPKNKWNSLNINTKLPVNIGRMTIRRNTEYKQAPPRLLQITPRFDLTSVPLEIIAPPLPAIEEITLPVQAVTSHPSFTDFLPDKQRIQQKTVYFINLGTTLFHLISQFCERNHSTSSLLPKTERGKIGSTVRHLLYSMTNRDTSGKLPYWNLELAAFYRVIHIKLMFFLIYLF